MRGREERGEGRGGNTVATCQLTWPVSEVVGGPGQVVRSVEAVFGCLVVGVVQNGKEEGLHERESGVVQEGRRGEDDIDLEETGERTLVICRFLFADSSTVILSSP